MDCQRCVRRQKSEDAIEKSVCGFPDGQFSTENWNCETLNAIRRTVWSSPLSQVTCSDEQYCAVLPLQGRFFILSWYKNRGRTEGAWYLKESTMLPLSLEQAEEYLLWS